MCFLCDYIMFTASAGIASLASIRAASISEGQTSAVAVDFVWGGPRWAADPETFEWI